MEEAQLIQPINTRIPVKKALLISYHHRDQDIIETRESLNHRYNSEGYTVKTIFVVPDVATRTPGTTPCSIDLSSKIAWLRESKEALLVFIHHGRDPDLHETESILKGSFTARMLALHGLNQADLGLMKIRYWPCFGGKKEATDFCETLHAYGAGNFIGDSKTVINGTYETQKKGYKQTEIEKMKAELSEDIVAIESDYKMEHNPPIHKTTGAVMTKHNLEQYQSLKKLLLVTVHNQECLRQTLNRGDSLVNIRLEEHPKITEIFQLPRKKDPNTGNFLYNVFYLAPRKTFVSQVTRTFDSKMIQEFQDSIQKKPVKTSVLRPCI